jgi:hypothetical protein
MQAAARNKDAEATRQRSKVLNAIETAFDRVGQGNTLTLKTAEQRRAEQQAGLGGFDEELGMADEDRDMAAAIAASLAGSFAGVQAPSAGAGASSQQQGSAAAAAAAAAAAGPGSSQGAAAGFDFLDEDEDPELAAAIAASLQDAPAAKMARTGEAPGEAAAAAAAVETAASAAVAPEEVRGRHCPASWCWWMHVIRHLCTQRKLRPACVCSAPPPHGSQDEQSDGRCLG